MILFVVLLFAGVVIRNFDVYYTNEKTIVNVRTPYVYFRLMEDRERGEEEEGEEK
jgi:hypothetical protein